MSPVPLLLRSAPCMHLRGVPRVWGGCRGCSLPATALAGGRVTAAHPCPGQEVFLGTKSPAGKGSRVDRQRHLFASFYLGAVSAGDHTS